MIQCCDCHQAFKSRNALFHYLCFKTDKIACCFNKKVKLQQLTAMLAKSSDKLFKIMSTDSVAAVKDIETDYEFQN